MRSLQCARQVVCLLALVVAAVPRAEAQLGGLRRAVERRVEQKAEDRVQAANLIEPTFDQTTLEITAERLDRYQAAMEKMKLQRTANRQRYEAMQTQRSALVDSSQAADNQRDRETYQRTGDQYDACRRDTREALEAAQEKRIQDLTARMQRDPVGSQSDPKVKEIMATMQAMSAAQQRGDAAGVQRATERMQTLMGGATDSASLDRAAVGKCGARPAKPASMVRSELLRARADSVEKAARTLIGASGGVKGAEVGMTDAQASMFWERIQSWLNGMQPSAPITRTFTKAEYELLVARRGELRKAFSGSE